MGWQFTLFFPQTLLHQQRCKPEPLPSSSYWRPYFIRIPCAFDIKLSSNLTNKKYDILISSADSTWLTTLGIVTSTTPSLEDALLLRRSCAVPLYLNFLASVLKDLVEAGGGALVMPHVGTGYLKMRISQEKEKEIANNLLAYSAWICARSAPPNFFSIKKERCGTSHFLTMTTLKLTNVTTILAEFWEWSTFGFSET